MQYSKCKLHSLSYLKPEVYEDYKKMQTVSKEKNSIEKTVEAYKNYNRV